MRPLAKYIHPLRVLLVLLLGAALAAVVLVLMLAVGTKPAEAAFPGANGKIAFASDRTTGTGVNNPTGDFEIFAMNPDGTGLEQLTDNTATDIDPAWSADGRLIAWTSYVDGNGFGEIYVWNYALLVPNQPRRLTTNTADDLQATFNHDGTKIAFTTLRNNTIEVYVMDTADTDNDGNGDNPTNLTNNTAIDIEPAFSPDGAKIAFRSNLDGNYEIYVMDTDPSTNDPVNLTNNTAGDAVPTWSPDGTKIAFASNRNGNSEIYRMNADGTDQKRLTKKAALDYQPAWSPDGKKIAFTSDRGGGDAEIYVMKAKPESRKHRPKNLTKNDVSDSNPDWRPISPP